MSAPSRHRTLAVTGVLGAIAVVALVLGWWRTHPTLLDPPGAEVGSYQQVGSTGIVGMTYPQPDTDSLLVHAARARVHRGDGATVRVLVCRHRPGDDALGTVRGRLDHWCAAVEEPSETRLGSHDQLVVTVTADKPGVVVVDGIEVTYSTGWQRGTQATGVLYRARFGTKTVREHLDIQQQ